MPLTNEELIARWTDRLIPTSNGVIPGCLEWHGARDPHGYGRCGHIAAVPGRPALSQLAHRTLWILTNGPIAPGLHLDHLCRNPPCCNVAHLEEVTPKVNVERGVSRERIQAYWATKPGRKPRPLKTHCARGHEYTPETTRLDPAGARHCRICDTIARDTRTASRAARRIAQLGHDPGPLSRRHVNKG